MKTLIAWLSLTSIVLAAGTPIERTPAKARARQNPFANDRTAAAAGAKLFGRECASCHGGDRQGIGKALPLSSDAVGKAPPGAIYWVITNGSLRRGMPSFSHLPEPERWQIVTYLQSQRSGPEKTVR